MNDQTIINDCLSGIEIISKIIYRNFLESFTNSEKIYAEATMFETTIPAFFIFDYVLADKQASLELRKKFYERYSDETIKLYSKTLYNTNLAEIIKCRYMAYAKLPVNTSRDQWQSSFINLLEYNLNGTKSKQSVEMDYGTILKNVEKDLISTTFSKARFIEHQIKNIYWIARFVDEVFKGKKFADIVEIMKNLDSAEPQKPIPEKKSNFFFELKNFFNVKPLPIHQYIDSLLEQRIVIDKKINNYVIKHHLLINKVMLNQDQKRRLNLESKLFSIWMISILVSSKEQRDILIEHFCIAVGLNIREKMIFLEEFKNRASNYNFVYEKWLKKSELSEISDYSWTLVGSYMTEIIVNLNPYFPFEDDAPQNDASLDLSMLSFFEDTYEETLEIAKQLKEKYNI